MSRYQIYQIPRLSGAPIDDQAAAFAGGLLLRHYGRVKVSSE